MCVRGVHVCVQDVDVCICGVRHETLCAFLLKELLRVFSVVSSLGESFHNLRRHLGKLD